MWRLCWGRSSRKSHCSVQRAVLLARSCGVQWVLLNTHTHKKAHAHTHTHIQTHTHTHTHINNTYRTGLHIIITCFWSLKHSLWCRQTPNYTAQKDIPVFTSKNVQTHKMQNKSNVCMYEHRSNWRTCILFLCLHVFMPTYVCVCMCVCVCVCVCFICYQSFKL